MNALVRQGLVGTQQVTRTIAIVGADVSTLARQYAGCVVTGALVIGAGHLLWGTACRGLGDSCQEAEARPVSLPFVPSDNAA